MLASSPSTPLPSPLRTVEQHCKHILRVIEKIQATIQPHLEDSNVSSSVSNSLSSYPEVEFVRVDNLLPTIQIQEKCNQIQRLISQIHVNLSPGSSPVLASPGVGSETRKPTPSVSLSSSSSSSLNLENIKYRFFSVVRHRPIFFFIQDRKKFGKFYKTIDSWKVSFLLIKIFDVDSVTDVDAWKRILATNEHYEIPPAYYVFIGHTDEFTSFMSTLNQFSEEGSRAKILVFELDREISKQNNRIVVLPASVKQQDYMTEQMVDQFEEWQASHTWIFLLNEKHKNKDFLEFIPSTDNYYAINVENTNQLHNDWDKILAQGEQVHFIISFRFEFYKNFNELFKRLIQPIMQELSTLVLEKRDKRKLTSSNYESDTLSYWTGENTGFVCFSESNNTSQQIAETKFEMKNQQFILITPTTPRDEIQTFFNELRDNV